MRPEPLLRVDRLAVARRDNRFPGWRAAIEAASTGGDETHYEVPKSAHRQLMEQYGGLPSAGAVRRRRFALGDAVESMLAGLGITKERVQWLTRKPCNCPARQRWLNQWGYARQEQIERIVQRAARWYGIS